MSSSSTSITPVIDPRELNDLTSFARRGGLGAATALTDCVAESPDQLMFMQGDQLILLKDMGPKLLASCEGVVGWVDRAHVKFESLASGSSKLPTRHSSLLPPKQASSREGTPTAEIPKTVLIAASPPGTAPTSPNAKGGQLDVKPSAGRPVSGPFELESPGVEQSEAAFFDQQQTAHSTEGTDEDAGSDMDTDADADKRESVSSVASSAFGGIGGFMMGTSPSTTVEDDDAGGAGADADVEGDEDKVEQLEDTPVPASAATFEDVSTAMISPPARTASLASPTTSTHSRSSGRGTSEESWDIYGDYARESMYAPLAQARRASQAVNRASSKRIPPPPFADSSSMPASPVSPGLSTRPPRVSSMLPPQPQSPQLPMAPAKVTPEVASEEADKEELASSPPTKERPETILESTRNSVAWSISSDGDHSAFAAARAALERVTAKREMRDQQREEEETRSRGSSPEDTFAQVEKPPSPTGSTAPLRPARRRPVAMDLTKGVPELKEIENQTIPAVEIETPKLDPETPRAPGRAETSSPVTEDFATPAAYGGRSLAMQIRLRIQREKELEAEQEEGASPKTPGAASRSPPKARTTPSTTVHLGTPVALAPHPSSPALASPIAQTADAPSKTRSPSPEPTGPLHDSPEQLDSKTPSQSRSSRSPTPSLEQSSNETPAMPSEMIFTPSSPTVDTVPTVMSTSSSDDSLLASPLPADSPRKSSIGTVSPISTSSPSLLIPPPRTHSPSLAPSPTSALSTTPWSPNSPSSPHSIDATRQAVEAATTPKENGKRARNMTLVGRMEADLSAAKGPVPITFLLGGPGASPLPSNIPIGLGPPPNIGRRTPSPEPRRNMTSPIPLDNPVLADPMTELKTAPSPFPLMPSRSVTSPIPPPPTHAGPKAGFFPTNRPRSRSFSAAVSKAMGRGKRDALPPLIINGAHVGPSAGSTNASPANSNAPPVPSITSPITSPSGSGPSGGFFPARRPFMRNASSPAPSTTSFGASSVGAATISPAKSVESNKSANMSTSTSLSSLAPITAVTSNHSNASSSSLPTINLTAPSSASGRTSNLSFSSKGSKTPRTTPRVLPMPVSHKDFEETVSADGMDFELVQPVKKTSLLPPGSPTERTDEGDLSRKGTIKSNLSGLSGSSLGHLAETDEWGFLKAQSPTPEIFQSRASAGGHRDAEQKWLSIISSPLPASGVPKKVRKLVLESGIPSSLRGKVWAWFMAPQMSARRADLYHELLSHDRGANNSQMENDILTAFPDHSLFADPTSPGQADLRNILRAFSHFAPAGYRSPMSLLAGMLLIHCVAEDAFWLLSGLINGALKDYYAKEGNGMMVDAAVFMGLMQGSEPKVAKLLRETGVQPIEFMEPWYLQAFLRCLPWPTALRVIDGIIAEGPRFLLVASLSIITLSRDRLLALPKTREDILGYLKDLPQDSLLLPETFMKNCESVKFRDEDLKKMRAAVGVGSG